LFEIDEGDQVITGESDFHNQ